MKKFASLTLIMTMICFNGFMPAYADEMGAPPAVPPPSTEQPKPAVLPPAPVGGQLPVVGPDGMPVTPPSRPPVTHNATGGGFGVQELLEIKPGDMILINGVGGPLQVQGIETDEDGNPVGNVLVEGGVVNTLTGTFISNQPQTGRLENPNTNFMEPMNLPERLPKREPDEKTSPEARAEFLSSLYEPIQADQGLNQEQIDALRTGNKIDVYVNDELTTLIVVDVDRNTNIITVIGGGTVNGTTGVYIPPPPKPLDPNAPTVEA